MPAYYKCVENTAVLAVRVWGRDLPELFAHAAMALFDLMAQPVEATDREHTVTVESLDTESLLVDWLNQLIFLHEVNGETYSGFEITALSPQTLRAIVTGGATGVKKMTLKTAMCYDLQVLAGDEGMEAQLILNQ